MADRETTFRLKFESEDMEKVFQALSDHIEETEQGMRDLEKVQKETFDNLTKDAKKSDEQLRKQVSNLDLNKVKFKELGDTAQDSLERISEKGGSATGAISRLGRAGGLAGTILAGAAAVIVGAFLDVKENADAAKVSMEGIRAVGNELRTRVFAGIRGIVKAFSGDLGGAALEFKAAGENIVESLNDANEAGKELERNRQRIAELNRGLVQEEARLNAELQKKQALIADETKTTAERIELINESAAIEGKINRQRIEQLNNELSLLEQEKDLSKDQEGITESIALVEADLIELRAANQVIEIQRQQQVNGLLKEEEEIRKRLVNQLKDTNALLTNTQAERSIEKQIQAFKDLRDSILSAGLGDEFAAELERIEDAIEALEKRLSGGLVKELKKLPTTATESLEVVSETTEDVVTRLEDDLPELFLRLQKAVSDQTGSFFEDLTEDQRSFLLANLQDVLGSVGETFIQSTQVQINRQEAVVDAREDNISELERQLAEQEKLESQGLANQSSRLRTSLQQEREILKREQDRRIELEKKAARQRLIANSIQQGSEITLASAKLLNQGASGFIPGLIAAAGGIALLFRIIAQARANAAAFAAPPKFRTGTDYLVGPSHEGGGITIEAEGGERIFSKNLNEALGGSKYSNEQIKEFALMGMNAEYGIAPMAAAIASGASARRKQEEYQAWERNEVLADVFRREIRDLKLEMRQTINERPTYYPLDQVGVREYMKGGVKFKERIIPKNK